jgi:hypothetical protein
MRDAVSVHGEPKAAGRGQPRKEEGGRWRVGLSGREHAANAAFPRARCLLPSSKLRAAAGRPWKKKLGACTAPR